MKFEGQLNFLFSSVVSLSWTLWRCKHSKLSTDILGWLGVAVKTKLNKIEQNSPNAGSDREVGERLKGIE